MEGWGARQRAVAAIRWSAGMGLGLAGFEMVLGVARSQVPMSVVQLLGLSAVNGLILALLAVLVSVCVSPLQLVLGAVRPTRAVAAQLGVTGGLLMAVPLARTAAAAFAADQVVVGGAFLVMILPFAFTLYLNARYWITRHAAGKHSGPGWLVVSAGLWLALCGLGLGLKLATSQSGGFALEGDRSVVLVTMDGVSQADLSAMPKLSAWAERGVVFEQAVSPSPWTRSAHATLLTGLHPLYHRAVFELPLSRGVRTFPELLQAEGYASGAFVSAWPLSASSGLAQGFSAYDDALFPGLPLGELLVPTLLLDGARALGLPDPARWRRGQATVNQALGWLGRQGSGPVLLWVHLADAAAGQDGGGPTPEGLNALDEALEALRLGLADAGRDQAVVLIAGATGHSLGGTLSDPAVRVPFVLIDPTLPGDGQTLLPRVPSQVRLMDAAATVLELLAIDGLDQQEGLPLAGYATGKRQASMWCPLVGRAPTGSALIGMRNQGLKYYQDLASGEEVLFDLQEDPQELRPLSDQGSVIEQARALLAPEITRYKRVIGSGAPSEPARY